MEKLNFKQWLQEMATSGPYIPGSVKKDKLMGTVAGAPSGGKIKSIDGEVPVKKKKKKKKKHGK